MGFQPRLAVGSPRDHVAIMRKDWGLTAKILSGEKTVETRWYQLKAKPWDEIYPGDRVFFKDSGDLVRVMARVDKVEQHEGLDKDKVIAILNKYATADGLGIDKGSLKKFYHLFKDKKYCIVIYLEHIQAVEPFDIDKTGFGMQSAWLVVDDIAQIKKT